MEYVDEIYGFIYDGMHCTELPSSHPYWSNYVKVRLIRDIERIEQQLLESKKDTHKKKVYFGIQANFLEIEGLIRGMKTKIYGANNLIGYVNTLPCGTELKTLSE